MNDQYSAPVTAERLGTLKGKTEALTDRLAIFHNHPLDSIELLGLADELEGLAQDYRGIATLSVEEHVEAHAARRFEVQHLIGHDWENISHEDAGIDNPEGTPITFATKDEAEADLAEHFEDCVEAGMEYDRRDWRVREVKVCNCAEVAHHGPTMPGHWFGCPKFGE